MKDIENQVKELSAEELAAFRQWFAQFDAEAWGRQFDADVKAGKLDGLAEPALRDHTAGRSKPLWITTPRLPFEVAFCDLKPVAPSSVSRKMAKWYRTPFGV